MRIGPSRAPLIPPPARAGRVEVRPVPPVTPVAPSAPEGPPPEVSDAPWPETLMEMSAVAQHLAQRKAERAPEEAPEPGETPEEPVGDPSDPQDLGPEGKAAVAKLQARDAEVRAHEAAHAAVAGSLGGSPSFVYQQGPDGKMYAIGGSVPINTSEGSTPEETLERAERVRAAALAPAKPSGADRAIAQLASSMAAQARVEKAAEAQDERIARYEANRGEGRPATTVQTVA